MILYVIAIMFVIEDVVTTALCVRHSDSRIITLLRETDNTAAEAFANGWDACASTYQMTKSSSKSRHVNS